MRAGHIRVAVHTEIAAEVMPMHDQQVLPLRLGHVTSFPSTLRPNSLNLPSATVWITESYLFVVASSVGWWPCRPPPNLLRSAATRPAGSSTTPSGVPRSCRQQSP